MGTDPVTTLKGNLQALSPVTRRAVESASAEGAVRIHAIGALLSASVQTPDKRWVRLHSGQDPVTEAERFLDRALPTAPPPVAMVIGPGLGYVLEALERRSAETRVIAIEPFAAMTRAMLERRDWRDRLQSGRLMILVGPEYLGASDAWRLVGAGAGSTPVLEPPVLGREFPAETARARGVATRIVHGAEANADARERFAGRYLLNTLKNLPALAAEGDVSALRDACRATPAIVVAAGPSLDNQVDHLRAVAERALIVAVDTALRPLQAAGIRPHLVVSLDPSELNAKHLVGLPDTDGTWLVGEGSIDASVFPEFVGHAFAFRVSDHHPWPWLQAHGFDRGTLRAWGSVLTTAFDLACGAGCDPIVFVGADLAYTDGQSHCRNTIYEARHPTTAASRAASFAGWRQMRRQATCQEKDIRGDVTLSTPHFVQFRDWLLSRAAAVGDRRLLNATGAGILHGPGIVQADFSTIPFSTRPLDLSTRLASAWNASLNGRRQVRQKLEQAMLREGGDGAPVRAWLEFARGTISSEQITACNEIAWRTPPVITTHPESLMRLPGWTARFRVAATGGLSTSVRWQVSTDAGSSWSDIVDATSRAYAFTVAADDNGRQFRAVFANAQGTAATDAATLTVAKRHVFRGFSGDSKPDVLWHDPATGANLVWHMDGVKRIGLASLDAVPDRNWRIAGKGDFNDDGKPDLLWRHSVTQALVVWYMDGVKLAEVAPLVPTLDRNWQIAGTGDFNGDGKPDILWRNAVTGDNVVWYMDGVRRTGLGWLDREPGLAWQIAGIGDFNDDGKPDILWRNATTGAMRLWLMDGVTRTDLTSLDAEAGLNWRVTAVDDFNDDGKPDILWHNAVTGAVRLWLMDGVTRTRDTYAD